MMKNTFWITLLLCALVPVAAGQGKLKKKEYVVLASREVVSDPAWNKVARALREKHGATLLVYDLVPWELLGELQRSRPRYVAIVEQPGRLDRDFIIKMHQSRAGDDDIFADFLWGGDHGARRCGGDEDGGE